MRCSFQVLTHSLPTAELVEQYCDLKRFRPMCYSCPDYGRNWSCPPGVPDPKTFVTQWEWAHLIGVKLIYDPDLRAEAATPERTEEIRQETYGVMKHAVIETLLTMEPAYSAHTIAAGRCELCQRCSRRDGQPCIQPDRRRYSFSAFGFDLSRISEELLSSPLQWASSGLPEYNMAIYAFLCNEKNVSFSPLTRKEDTL